MRATKLLLVPLLIVLWHMFYSLPVVAAEPHVSARAALIMDADSAQILYERNAHMRLPMASTTKVMTGLLGLERLRPSDLVRVSRYAASMEPSKIHLKPGEVIRTDEILPAILLKSANDASTALAERVSGSEEAFARLMTRRAKELGAHNTRFENASGLPADGHYSTAFDLAILLRYAMQRRDFANIIRQRVAQVASEAGRTWTLRNHNRLLWTFPGALGGKTGWTRASKHCYVGMAGRNGHTLVVSVLGSTRLWDDVRELFTYGFSEIDVDRVQVVLGQPAKLSPPSPSLQARQQPPPAPHRQEISNGNPAGYTVQVGAFRQKKRAEMLRQRLRKRGYSAYVTVTGSNAARLYRVRVGEFDSQGAARRVVGRLKTQMGLEGMVATAE